MPGYIIIDELDEFEEEQYEEYIYNEYLEEEQMYIEELHKDMEEHPLFFWKVTCKRNTGMEIRQNEI